MYFIENGLYGKQSGLLISHRTALIYVEDLNLKDGLAGLNKLAGEHMDNYVDIGEFNEGADGKSAAITLSMPDKESGKLKRKTLGYMAKVYEPFLKLSSDGYRVGIIHDYCLKDEDNEPYDDNYIVLAVPVDLANLNSTTAKEFLFYDLPDGHWNSVDDQVPIGWREFYNQVLRQDWSD